jgi:hypothetical protein
VNTSIYARAFSQKVPGFTTTFSPIQNHRIGQSSSLPSNGTELDTSAEITKDIRNLGDDDLQQLASRALAAMRTRGLTPPLASCVTPENNLVQSTNQLPQTSPLQNHPIQTLVSPPKHLPDIYANARFEQIACAGLAIKFDGSAENLIPTLDLIHVRHINEVWNSATYIANSKGTTLDLIHHFSKIQLNTVKQQAKTLWDGADSEINGHTHGTATYNARLFGVFLLNSLTPDFAALLFSRINHLYRMDGPLLFIMMCTHIHHNHVAFVESVKNKIRLSTLAEYKNDVPAYLHFLKKNLCVITSMGDADNLHNDLLAHIFMQLRLTTIPIFQQKVLEWQRSYMENTLQTSPTQLVKLADEECQILKHSQQWVETIDPSVIAMQALLQSTNQGNSSLFQSLEANLSALTKMHQNSSRDKCTDQSILQIANFIMIPQHGSMMLLRIILNRRCIKEKHGTFALSVVGMANGCALTLMPLIAHVTNIFVIVVTVVVLLVSLLMLTRTIVPRTTAGLDLGLHQVDMMPHTCTIVVEP